MRYRRESLPFGDIGSSEYGLLLRGEVCGPPRPGIEWGLPPIPGGQGKHGRVGKPGIIPPPGGNPGGSRLPKPGGSPHPFDAAAAAAAAAAMDGGNPAAFAAWRNGKGRCVGKLPCGRGWGKLPAPPGAPGPPLCAAANKYSWYRREYVETNLRIFLEDAKFTY